MWVIEWLTACLRSIAPFASCFRLSCPRIKRSACLRDGHASTKVDGPWHRFERQLPHPPYAARVPSNVATQLRRTMGETCF